MNYIAGLTQEDSELIDFVVTCLFCSAISRDEFHSWCESVIRENSATRLPSYIFDLYDYQGPLAKIFKIIGFVPSTARDEDSEAALCGIAMKRNVTRDDWPVSPSDALEKLQRNPHILSKFRYTFPFINI